MSAAATVQEGLLFRRGSVVGRPTPDWNARWESHWVSDGIHVKIANALGFETLKPDALEHVTREAIGHPTPEGSGHAH